ncbi:SDR family oxidoreductase [Mesorhizobium sp. WSM3224]|uniref:SDR family NAD(P)-dependent oxidoreductase n=1 Tax=Mesorhizobium sp. WSM3224 TaxID=1040986 RepID=UPI0018DD44CB|nr:SDR family oxidoreductase [Mesorhizobium sp. WSM3224]
MARVIRDNGGQAEVCFADLAEEQSAGACVEKAIDRFGKLNVLVNNAGVFLEVAECQDYSVENFDRTMLDNMRSVFLMTKFALPHLQETRGAVLNAGSEAGEMGEGNNARGIAFEQAKYGVRANCVCPGPVDTAWTHKKSGPIDEQMEKMTVAGTVLGRRGTPEEIANVYAFLASDEASNVTGALWYVDGGTTIAKGWPGQIVPAELATQPKPSLPRRHSHDGLRNKATQNRLH